MRRIKGLRDIKTCCSLARTGRLVSVARGLPRISSSETHDGSLRREILTEQRRYWQELIVELEEFVAEGIPGVASELQRLREKVSRFQF